MKDRSLFGLLALLATVLIVLVGCSSIASTSEPQTVQVRFSNTTIHSSLTTFSPGVPYHFVITNQGQVTHEFMIVPVSVVPSAANENALAMISSVAPGETKTLDYTFPSSAVRQSLEFACFLHQRYDVGMGLPITITS